MQYETIHAFVTNSVLRRILKEAPLWLPSHSSVLSVVIFQLERCFAFQCGIRNSEQPSICRRLPWQNTLSLSTPKTIRAMNSSTSNGNSSIQSIPHNLRVPEKPTGNISPATASQWSDPSVNLCSEHPMHVETFSARIHKPLSLSHESLSSLFVD